MRLNPSLRIYRFGDLYMIAGNCAENSNLATVYTLNRTAGMLWKSVEGKEFTTESLAGILCGSYDVSAERAAADAAAIVRKWVKAGLVIV